MPYAIDLFCGAGGMSEGLIQAGFHILFSSDINEQVELTYRNRHNQLGLIQGVNTHYERADIRDLTGEFIMKSINALEIFQAQNTKVEIDAIFGGPPCQGFSLAGKRERNDPRNMLFREYLRVVNEIRPKYVIMENVEGFMTMQLENFVGINNREYIGVNLISNILLNEFHQIGYETLEPRLLDASDFGVPQRRKRAIFIAYLPEYPRPNYPTATLKDVEKPRILDAIGDLIKDNRKRKRYNSILSNYQKASRDGRTLRIDGEQVYHDGAIYNYEFASHEKYIIERFSLYKSGEDTATLRKRILERGIGIKSKKELLKLLYEEYKDQYTQEEIIRLFSTGRVTEDMVNVLLTKKNNRTKLCYDSLSPTVLTLPDDYISPFENRILTVREMARLQSFDDSFIFLGKRTTGGDRRRTEVPQYTQVGNAVPPLLAKAIAEEIIRLL